jgi:hypothetical protein
MLFYLYRFRFFQKGVEMKKWINLTFALVLVLGLFLSGSPKSAYATIAEPPSPSIAPGDWEWTSADVVGEEIPMGDILTKPAPWLQLITNGLEIKAPATICHPFRGVQFGWFGSIYKLVGEKWVKQVTTNEWVPTTEGRIMSCAQVTSAGTYALFGYWVKPVVVEEEPVVVVEEPAPLPKCTVSPFGNPIIHFALNRYYEIGTVLQVPEENVLIRYEILNTNGLFSGDLTGSTLTDASGVASFIGNEFFFNGTGGYVFTLRFYSPACYTDQVVSSV